MTYAINWRSVVGVLILSSFMVVPFVAFADFEVPDEALRAQLGLAKTAEGTDGLAELITNITSFLAGLLAVLAILVIVVAGILYITSGGDEGRISTAKTWLTYAIIGLIVALLAWVIVSTVGGALQAG